MASGTVELEVALKFVDERHCCQASSDVVLDFNTYAFWRCRIEESSEPRLDRALVGGRLTMWASTIARTRSVEYVVALALGHERRAMNAPFSPI